MKYIKTLGIAVFVAAALAGYLSASAFAVGETLPETVLCKTAETACAPANQFASGTVVSATLKAGTKAKLKAGFAIIECGASNVSGPANYSAENHTPHGILTTEEFTECNAGQTVTVEEEAEIILHHEVETGKTDTGAITVAGGKVKVAVGSVNCTYGGTVAGSSIMANGGAPGIVKAEAGVTKLTKVAGSAACLSPAEWIAEYEITAPTPFHISTTGGEPAPGTVLCEGKMTVCESGSRYPASTEVVAVLSEGTKSKLSAGFATIECGGSIVAGNTSAVEGVEVPIATETFTKCNAGQTVTVNTKGKLVISHKVVTKEDPVGTGAATIVGNSVTVSSGGTECTYGGTSAGKSMMVNGGNPAFAEATEAETELEKIAGGVTCASSAKWIASYEIVRPKPLYVGTTH